MKFSPNPLGHFEVIFCGMACGKFNPRFLDVSFLSNLNF